MTTLAVRRTHLPFWPTVGLAVVAWLIAWFITLPLANWVAYDLLGLQEGSQLGDAVAFFLYDVPKVLLLLTGIVTLVSFLRSYVSPERVRSALAGRGVAARDDGGRGLRGRHPVLLLLGGAAVHRLRRGRCPARRHVRLPHRLADGQRDRDRAAVGPVRSGRHR